MIRRSWRDLDLRTKFLASVLIIVTAAIGISGLIFYFANARATERRVYASADDLAGQMSRNVDVYIGDVESFSRVVVGDGIILRKLDPSVLRTLGLAPVSDSDVRYELLTIMLPQKSIQGIYVFAGDGTVHYATHGKALRAGYTVRQEPWYSVLSGSPDTPFLLWPTGSETTVFQNPEQVLSLVRPISYKLGQTYGYLKIDLKMAGFADFLPAAPDAAHDGRVLILNDDGRVIYDNSGETTGQTIGDLGRAGRDSGHGRIAWRGMDRIYSAQRSAYTGWTTWLLIPARPIAAELQRSALTVLLVCLTALGLMGLTLYGLAGRVTEPLRTMATAMRRVEGGDLAVRMPRVEANDEVGLLGRGFNTMLDSLERLITQVLQAELREKDARLLALQAQINPHFLYNTLNGIRALIRRDQPARAAAAVDSLAGMLRYSISDWDKPALLRDELAHARNYADIQKVRFGERISVDYDVPPDLLDAQVPKLSLQPLMENALTHGREGRKAALHVTVSARCCGQLLELRVRDDGAGMDERSLAALHERLADVGGAAGLPTRSGGIGLVNIDRRLKLLYGRDHGLTIENAPGHGIVVTLLLPCVEGDGAPTPASESPGDERNPAAGDAGVSPADGSHA